MNIEQAKTEIKRTASIYLMKDSFGSYRMERQNQRPIFMIGAPGIGKTAAVAQVAEELHLPLVSYTMTHHTRQSAIGLPFIRQRTYQGKTFDVSVYSLSEIIASVYEAMEKSGKKEGILFLDEINCVSETLAPAMLQFLQYKTFGNHDLPDGWIIVAAGNPQEFNHNARSFDIATLDRLKILNVEPDYASWRTYAEAMHIHPSILSFLDIHSDCMFHVESGIDGKIYVTPRGWEDLSRAMVLYEEAGYPVDETLVHEYLHDDRIVNAFVSYFSLYDKYRKEYSVSDILNGKISESAIQQMKQAGWDEKISVTNMMLDAACSEIRSEQILENGLRLLRDPLRALKSSGDFQTSLLTLEEEKKEEFRKEKDSGEYSRRDQNAVRYCLTFLKKSASAVDYKELQDNYSTEAGKMKNMADAIERQLNNLFSFLKTAADEQEVLIAVTRLTADEDAAAFIGAHGCEAYYENCEALNIRQRSDALRKEIDDIRKENQ